MGRLVQLTSKRRFPLGLPVLLIVELSRFEHSTLIAEIALSNVPLNGRRFLDLALLAPMTYQEKERGQLSLSGARGINGSISIDGADFNQPFFGGQRGGERSPFAYL